MDALSLREKHRGLVLNPQLDDSHCELKGVRVDKARYRQGQIAASQWGPTGAGSGAPKQMPSKCQASTKQMPSRYRGGKQPDEAMPSSRGDARAAERARTQEGRRAPDCPTRSADLDPLDRKWLLCG
jgi:hypothetical protein